MLKPGKLCKDMNSFDETEFSIPFRMPDNEGAEPQQDREVNTYDPHTTTVHIPECSISSNHIQQGKMQEYERKML